jgi:uncharacterized protein with von Willebrand factor type A (vWA) domain
MASVGTAGGTDFFRVPYGMRSREPELKPCDIVLITDGEYEFTPDQLEYILKVKKETRSGFTASPSMTALDTSIPTPSRASVTKLA